MRYNRIHGSTSFLNHSPLGQVWRRCLHVSLSLLLDHASRFLCPPWVLGSLYHSSVGILFTSVSVKDRTSASASCPKPSMCAERSVGIISWVLSLPRRRWGRHEQLFASQALKMTIEMDRVAANQLFDSRAKTYVIQTKFLVIQTLLLKS